MGRAAITVVTCLAVAGLLPTQRLLHPGSHAAPGEESLRLLWRCVEAAVQRELGQVSEWDVYVSATTEQARQVVGEALTKNAKGARRLLGLPNIDRNRRPVPVL